MEQQEEEKNNKIPNDLNQFATIKNLTSEEIECLIYKIEEFKGDENAAPVINHYTIDFVMSLIDKNKIKELEENFESYPKKGVDIIDFIKIFLISFNQKKQETLFLTLALIDLFKEITDTRNIHNSTITINDITSFACDVSYYFRLEATDIVFLPLEMGYFLSMIQCQVTLCQFLQKYFVEKNMTTYQLPTVKVPEQKKFATASQRRIRDIDINPPVICGRIEDKIKRLVVSSLVTDSSKHNNAQISQGFYASGYKRIFTLDSMACHIKVYKLNNKLDTIIGPSGQDDKETIIIGFAYSEREQRIGATRKDCSLQFWDKQDDFKFQKCFSVTSQVVDYQKNIWYLDSQRSWVTTDKSNSINVWDLETEKIRKQMTRKEANGDIIDMVEVSHMQLVAVASMDKKVCVWDFEKENVIFMIELGSPGIHHLIYSYQYQSLITAGYENVVRIYRLNAQYLDSDSAGQLIGHSSMVTAVQAIEKTPMIVSSDDQGNIKVWDIRSMKCLQTINIGFKSVMTQIISISEKNMICLLGSRLNFISFDQEDARPDSEDAYPIKVEYNQAKQEITVCTRKDVRFLRMNDGRITKFFQGLFPESDEEITAFAYLNQCKNFILGSSKGQLSFYSQNNGEQLKLLANHSAEITSLKMDFPNKLIVSSSLDSSVMIQKETNSGGEQKRVILNSHFKKEVKLMEVSIYHNVIVTGSFERQVYLWDYEFVKLVGCIEIDNGTEPMAFSFVNGYHLLLIATTAAQIYLLRFNVKELKATFELLSFIDIQFYKEIPQTPGMVDQYQGSTLGSQQSENFVEDDILDEGDCKSEAYSLRKQPGIIRPTFMGGKEQSASSFQTENIKRQSLQNGKLKRQNSPKLTKSSVQGVKFENLPRKSVLQENSLTNSPLIQLYPAHSKPSLVISLPDSNSREHKNSFPSNRRPNSVDSEIEEQNLPQEWGTKLLTEIEADPKTGSLSKLVVHVSTNKGGILSFSLEELIQEEDINISEQSAQRSNYNPLRSATEDFLSLVSQISQDVFSIPSAVEQEKRRNIRSGKDSVKLIEFQAHREALTTFSFVEINQKCFLTSSQDQYVRIWDLKGNLLGNLNINHPLPITWKIQFDEHDRIKKKIFYALKIIDIMFSKYKDDLYLRSLIQVDTFLNAILNSSDGKNNLQEAQSSHLNTLDERLNKVTLMKDEYTPRDMHFNEIKHIFEKELRGMSLKQLEANKRLLQAQFPTQQKYAIPVIDINSKRRNMEEQEALQFLGDEWRNRVVSKLGESDFSKKTFSLGKKLDQVQNLSTARFNYNVIYAQNNGDDVVQNSPKAHKNKVGSPRKLDRSSNLIQSKRDITSTNIITERDDNNRWRGRDSLGVSSFRDVEKNLSRKASIQLNKLPADNKITEIKEGKKKRNKTLDFLEYAQEKNYLDESVLHNSHLAPITNVSTANNSMNLMLKTSPNVSSINNLNVSVIPNLNASLQHNNSTTIMHTDRSSILSGRSMSSSNLQKAKMSIAFKNLDLKLRYSRYHADQIALERLEKVKQRNQILREQEKPFFMDSIVQEALQEVNKSEKDSQNSDGQISIAFQSKGMISRKNSLGSNFNRVLSHKGSFTERQFQELKLPVISQKQINMLGNNQLSSQNVFSKNSIF